MPHIDIKLSEIPFNTPLRVEHENKAMVVVRTEAGISAFDDVCPHAFWPLSAGDVFDGVLECPGHGWEFDLTNGRCVNAPAYCLTPVSTSIHGEMVRLEWVEELESEDAAERDEVITLS
jgi:nitrite reductase/ring-hydroxylating ferredoxin subunit